MKEKAVIYQINGIEKESGYEFVSVVLKTKNDTKQVFVVSDEDHQDKYLFRDLDFLKTIAEEFYKIYQEYDIQEVKTIKGVEVKSFYQAHQELELN